MYQVPILQVVGALQAGNGGMEEWELDSSTGSIQSRQGKAEGFYLDMLMGTNEKKHALHVSASVKD